MINQYLLVILIITTASSHPLMIDHHDILVETIKNTTLGVFFYGYQNSIEYEAYQKIIPTQRQLFTNLQFYFIAADKYKLDKPIPSLEMYRKINDGDWIVYKGAYDVNLMAAWVRRNCHDQLPEILLKDYQYILEKGNKGLILLDYGHFTLLRTKILIVDYCKEEGLVCRKCTLQNGLFNKIVQLMQAQKERGVSKLAYFNPNTYQLQIYTNKHISQITLDDLKEFIIGKEGIVRSSYTQNPTQDIADSEIL